MGSSAKKDAGLLGGHGSLGETGLGPGYRTDLEEDEEVPLELDLQAVLAALFENGGSE